MKESEVIYEFRDGFSAGEVKVFGDIAEEVYVCDWEGDRDSL